MTSENSKQPKASRRTDSLARRVGALKRERAELMEEILQLKAAANVWRDVCQQHKIAAGDLERRNSEEC